MKFALIPLLLAMVSTFAHADAPQTDESPLARTSSWPTADISQTSHQLYQLKEPIPLSARATALASAEWLKTGFAPSMVGTNGQVMYPYGQSHPAITCAPEHICVLQLLPDEHITNLSIGDSVRWLIQPAMAGNRPVVVIKPTVAGLNTNLVVTTDAGRVYYITLVSNRHDYVPLVGFYDPQQLVINMQQQAEAAKAAEQAKIEAQKQAVVAPLGTIDPATLDFNFKCKPGHGSDDEDFKPVRIFAGNGHTYLQMPTGMKDADKPAVFNYRDNQTEMMNSRLVHDYVVIDGLPQKFELVVGVGDNARSEVCEHNPKTGLFD
ncbi:MAG: conjugal transfer protein TrbG [Thiomonas sp. 20-64-5]|nr:MAG: conjugal transfer protein TrbG [Thiomonas sp. 20-64-5]